MNFIIHFFLEILHFKESLDLISQQHFGPKLENQNFARYRIGGKISIIILLLILNYFQAKLIKKFFKKFKKSYFGAILGINNFLWKKALCQFLNIPIMYHCA